LLCEEKDYVQTFPLTRDNCNALYNYYPNNQNICTLIVPFNGSLPYTTELPNNQTLEDFQITSYGVYYLLLANCDKNTLNLQFDMVLKNPNGEQLGFGYIPLPALYTVQLVLWIIAFGAWCFNWIKYRTQNNKLHRIITLFPSTKLIFCVSAVLYWNTFATEGQSTLGILIFFIVMLIGYIAVMYALLLIIASGWGICRSHLSNDKFAIAGIVVGLIVTQTAGLWLKGFFNLLNFIIYIITIVMIFRYINRNLIDLASGNANLSDSEENEATRPVRDTTREKERMFKSFKVIMLGYIVLMMVILIVQMLFMYNYPWVTYMLTELLEIMLFICIGWTFRLQNVNIYYRLQSDIQSQPLYRNSVELQSSRNSADSTSTSPTPASISSSLSSETSSVSASSPNSRENNLNQSATYAQMPPSNHV